MDVEKGDFKDGRGNSKGCRDNLKTQPKEITYEIKYQENQNVRNSFLVFGSETLEEGMNSNVGIRFKGNVCSYKGCPYKEDTGHFFGPRNDPSNDIPIGYLKKHKRCHDNDCKSCKQIHHLRKKLSKGSHSHLLLQLPGLEFTVLQKKIPPPPHESGRDGGVITIIWPIQPQPH
jgi:hypothetical protein